MSLKKLRENERQKKEENKEWEMTETQWGLGYWTVLLGPLGARLFGRCSVGGNCSVIGGGLNHSQQRVFLIQKKHFFKHKINIFFKNKKKHL